MNDPLPWTRDRWARLVDQLSAAGASVIAFDVVFSTKSSEEEQGNDVLFADAIARAGNVVLGEGITDAETPDDGPPIAKPEAATGVFDPFAAAAHGNIGHVQVTQDPADGVVRRIPVVFDVEGTFIPSLSAAAVATARE